MVVTLSATLLLPLQFAVLSGILFSLAHYILKSSLPRVSVVLPDDSFVFLIRRPDKPCCPQLGIVEIHGDLYFGSSNHVEEHILENMVYNPSQRFLLLRMTYVNHIDISGIHMLESVLRTYRDMGGDVFITRYRKDVLDIFYTSGFTDRCGVSNLLKREQDAIGQIFHRVLDPAICIYECPHRGFLECQNLPKRLDLIGEHPQLEPLDGRIAYITPEQLWEDIHSVPAPELVDVREPGEFHRGHIIQARSLPLLDLLEDPDQLPQDRGVVLVCRSGRRSERAANTLSIKGYENVRVLSGGMLAWEAENLIEAVDDTGHPSDATQPDNAGKMMHRH